MPRKEVTLFLIEDDDLDAEAIERAFSRSRIANEIVRARNGAEALTMLQQNQVTTPYLILLDINMPKMNGIEFLEKIRQDDALKGAIVFVLTTSQRDEDMVAAYRLQAAGYICKDKVGDDFMRLTDMLGNYWRIVELPEA